MTQEEINLAIESYSKLEELVEKVSNKLNQLDPKNYRTGNYIENISFEKGVVYVTCDDSYSGCGKEYCYVKFPVSWLSLSDEELENVVITARELRLEKEREKKRLEDEKLKLEKEEKDRKEFERLKKKFGE